MLTSISKQLARDEDAGCTASYAVTAADLRPLHADNSLVKYADDTYLVIPATHADTRVAELGHIAAWAADNNLRLNNGSRVLRQPTSTPHPAAAAAARYDPRHYAESARRHVHRHAVGI